MFSPDDSRSIPGSAAPPPPPLWLGLLDTLRCISVLQDIDCIARERRERETRERDTYTVYSIEWKWLDYVFIVIVSPFSFLDSPAGDVKVFFSEAYFVFLSSPSTPFAHAIRISTHTNTTQTQRLGFSAFVDARALG